MQFCVCVLVGAFHTYKAPLRREPFSLTSAMPYLMVDKINPYSNQYRFFLDNARFKCYNYTVSKKTQFRCII